MRAGDEVVHDEPHNTKTSGPLSIPISPKLPNEWGYAGSRYHGATRAFPLQGAPLYEEHIRQSSDLPFTMETGRHVLPDGLQEAIGFVTHRRNAGNRGFWLKQLPRI